MARKFFIHYSFLSSFLLATPVVYALVNDKKTRTYTLLFQALKRKAVEMKMKFAPSRIISDFESSMITTVQKQVNILSCSIYCLNSFL